MGFYRFAIGLYQKHLSPRKGFRCAHSLEHGGPGCSGAVLQILETHGLFGGFRQIGERFISCEESAQQRKEREKKQKNQPTGGGGGDSSSKACGLDTALDCATFDCTPDCGDCGSLSTRLPGGSACLPGKGCGLSVTGLFKIILR
jgi:putative component of membrane protein insertase Oxa1/YidC/SpoIIIJ protein YidD